jgi:hypothetical protein
MDLDCKPHGSFFETLRFLSAPLESGQGAYLIYRNKDGILPPESRPNVGPERRGYPLPAVSGPTLFE